MNLEAISAFFVISTSLILARLYARLFMLRNGGLDDVFAVLAYVCFSLEILCCASISQEVLLTISQCCLTAMIAVHMEGMYAVQSAIQLMTKY